MRRFYTAPENISGNSARIIEDAAHITKVLRMKEGDEILLFDGSGYEYTATLSHLDTKECLAEITDKNFSEQEPEIRLTVFQGIPKSGKMESIIQKSVELGVTAIIPTAMDRCVVKIEQGKKEQEKQKRWSKVALEAAKQCGRGLVPEISLPVTFKEAVEKLKEMDLALMPYEVLGHQGDRSLKSVLQNGKFKNIGVIIGPEGGFSDAEAELAKSSGINLVGLGKRILRTETVASTIASIIMYETGEM